MCWQFVETMLFALAFATGALFCFATAVVLISLVLSSIAFILFVLVLGINFALFGCYNFMYYFVSEGQKNDTLVLREDYIKAVGDNAVDESLHGIRPCNLKKRRETVRNVKKEIRESNGRKSATKLHQRKHESALKNNTGEERTDMNDPQQFIVTNTPFSSPSKLSFKNRQEARHQVVYREQIRETIAKLKDCASEDLHENKADKGEAVVLRTMKAVPEYKSILKTVSSYEKQYSCEDRGNGYAEVHSPSLSSSGELFDDDRENTVPDIDMNGSGVGCVRRDADNDVPLRRLDWNMMTKNRSPKKISFTENTTFTI